jgi:hypothetical protein
VQKVLVIDPEVLEAGNLVRHTLQLNDLDEGKAAALARRLNASGPHVSATAIAATFPRLQGADAYKVSQCDLVLDATGSDEVLLEMSRYHWKEDVQFVSLSLGMAARRLYCFSTSDAGALASEFRKNLAPWLDRERTEFHGVELPRGSIGCWHPVFPARIDDIWMLAAVVLKQLEDAIGPEQTAEGLIVFEQNYEDGRFAGIRRAELEE